MHSPKRLHITITKAWGHGVHALLPSEAASCEVLVPGTRQEQATTRATQPEGMPHPACRWDQRLDFDYEGSSPRSIEVQLKGQRSTQSKPAGGGDGDLVGAGRIDLQQVLKRGTQQVLEVPLTKAGRQLGAVELVVEHQAWAG